MVKEGDRMKNVDDRKKRETGEHRHNLYLDLRNTSLYFALGLDTHPSPSPRRATTFIINLIVLNAIVYKNLQNA